MKKRLFTILFILLLCFVLVGCENEEETSNQTTNEGTSKSVVEANFKFGWVKFYMPEGYDYHPELRGLIYSEDTRQIYSKGDPSDRSTVIIIDLIKQEYNDYIENYVNKLNENLGDNGYKLKSEKPKLFLREKYEGKSGETIIYNYTYLTKFNDYIYTITVSGPQSSEKELEEIVLNIRKSIIVGE